MSVLLLADFSATGSVRAGNGAASSCCFSEGVGDLVSNLSTGSSLSLPLLSLQSSAPNFIAGHGARRRPARREVLHACMHVGADGAFGEQTRASTR